MSAGACPDRRGRQLPRLSHTEEYRSMSPFRPRSALAALLVLSALGAGLEQSVSPAQAAGEQKVAWKDSWEGPWLVLSWTESGHPVPADYSRAIQVTFRGRHVSFSLFGQRWQGPFKTDGTKSPGHFDVWFKGRTEPRQAIYRLERDRLTLCFPASRYDQRPARFESKPGADNILIVLQRGEIRLDAAEEKRARSWARLNAQKQRSRNNLRHLSLATITYADANKRRLPGP